MMSSDETPNLPTARHSREAVREKAKKVRAQQSRVRVMRRIIIGMVAVAAVGGISVASWMAVNSAVSKPELAPTGMDGDGIVVRDITNSVAQPITGSVPDEATTEEPPAEETEASADTGTDAPVDIHIYVDYLSRGAGEFEGANARLLKTWLDEGLVSVTYHPIAILTANSAGSKYSLRAAAAAACVVTHSPADFYDYNHDLLVKQPDLDTEGSTDVELADLAVAVGVENPKVVRDCIQNQDFLSWARDATDRALEGPLADLDTAAPTVLVNGQVYVGRMTDPSEFSQFVLTVASDGEPAPAPTEEATEAPAPTEEATPPAEDAAEVPAEESTEEPSEESTPTPTP